MLQTYQMLFEMMEKLGKKWAVPLLIFLLFYEQTTFSIIKKQLKMTSRVLSRKLKLLETLGLIEKAVVDSTGKAYYSLSDKGKKLSQMMLELGEAVRNFP